MEFDSEDMTDRDLRSIEFVAWSTRQQTKRLLELVSLAQVGDQISARAKLLFEAACEIDDMIESQMGASDARGL